ncbi:cytochrome P450 315a1, mitochondrial-like [Argiope bruennichi]|uniref:Cytochrome P450 315a1 like protein n=1 Tax=Argiope bruennichi TaxID=94029 RepID=A0A8T0FEX6_ARGBR|nr:cytochrome P450 315a1, mitochondrial-like [Argiope bruennichi]XP_055942452.1 cytochrome P450 315a1, mitochondrial-like [Argiope bruennichi]KAF8787483.1 Cytochrome P450 315a1 like protein [Argiope bruennichi]
MQFLRVVRHSVLAVRKRSSAAATATVGCPFHRAEPERPSVNTVYRKVLPYSAIPSSKGLPIVGTLPEFLMRGGARKLHEYFHMRHQQHGPIFREKIGSLDVVVISDEDHINRVYSAEGRHPIHMVPEAWVKYNEKRGIERGLFFMDGENWRSKRMMLNPALIPKINQQYGAVFSEVTDDVINRWDKIIRIDDGVLPNLENELYNWSVETVGTAVMGRRMGFVSPPGTENKMQEFVHQVQQIFKESAKLAVVSADFASKFRLPVWKRFEKAADAALEMARSFVEERIAEINNQVASGEKVEGILKRMIDHNLPTNEIVNIVADLILAAADTTSHATQWALYSLAKHPECQERILEEINRVVPKGEIVNNTHVQQIPYLAKTIKETLRMYPIASFLTRALPTNIILGNYEIPAGKMFFMSQYTVGRDPRRFKDPEQFNPDRWQLNTTMKNGCMPFGHGSRGCIGKIVAELKMQLLLAKAVQQYHLEAKNKDIGITLRMITTPTEPIQLHLSKRT